MIRTILLLTLLTLTNTAIGDSYNNWYLDSTIASKHFSSNEYNEKNFGLGLTYQVNPKFEVRAGYYKNSHYKQSEYLVLNYITHSYTTINNSWNINAGIGAGIVTGYKGTRGENSLSVGPIQGAILPNVSVTYKPLGIKFSLSLAGNAIGLQGSYQLRTF